jgi:hypothetical protein
MRTDQVERVEAGPRTISRRTVVNAPAAELFEMLADPRRHPEVDGSGTVLGSISGPERLALGETFSMKMNTFGWPYWIRSRVTGFEENRLIEWQHPAGHRWRWEFEELAPGRTQVTETWNYGTSRMARILELIKYPAKNANGIRATLVGLRDRYTTP